MMPRKAISSEAFTKAIVDLQQMEGAHLSVRKVFKRLLVWIQNSKLKHWFQILFQCRGDTELYCSFKMQRGLSPVWFGKGFMTQHQTSALITRRKAPFPVALYHFHLIHVESQKSNREGRFPVHKKLIVVFLEVMFERDKVSSTVLLPHFLYIRCRLWTALHCQLYSKNLQLYSLSIWKPATTWVWHEL